MKRFFGLLVAILFFTSFRPFETESYTANTPLVSIDVEKATLPVLNKKDSIRVAYTQLSNNELSWEAFRDAMLGRQILQESIQFENSDIITVIDFSKASTQERLFVIDLATSTILFKSLVAHGQNTGENWAKNFSNRSGSYQSSLGFYKTAEIYNGSKGFSMKLDGLEPQINHLARERGIVVHAADYVSNSFAQAHGRLGRSQGCPALPKEKNQAIIKAISGGSLFFIYAPVEDYFQKSAVLKSVDTFSIEEI